MTEKKIVIPEITDLDMAFGTVVGLPVYSQVPDEFKRAGSKWNRLFNDMFAFGLKAINLTPKSDIDPAKAWRHIRALSGSFQPKHEHKEAGVAYLMSQYFEDATWERAA